MRLGDSRGNRVNAMWFPHPHAKATKHNWKRRKMSGHTMSRWHAKHSSKIRKEQSKQSKQAQRISVQTQPPFFVFLAKQSVKFPRSLFVLLPTLAYLARDTRRCLEIIAHAATFLFRTINQSNQSKQSRQQQVIIATVIITVVVVVSWGW